MWFRKLMGFDEENPDHVRANLTVKGDRLISKVNKSSYVFGELEVVSLAELRERVDAEVFETGEKICIREVVGDVRDLHCDGDNEGALFQVASQFNLLEMVSPDVTPEEGVDIYEADHTQGPACAIACGAATIYRNYFTDVNGQTGQSCDNQIDCLYDIGEALGNADGSLWTMKNGYVLFTQDGLIEINKKLKSMSDEEREELKGMLQVGIMWDTQVTLTENGLRVSQVYCSAVPVLDAEIEKKHWEPFASLILEAAYEATFYAALENSVKYSSDKMFLTLLGGGAFGNDSRWILDAVKNAFIKFKNTSLDVRIVSRGNSQAHIVRFVSAVKRELNLDIDDHTAGINDSHRDGTFKRLLWSIHALAGGGFTKKELIAANNISSRTADRDIEYLKDYINIASVRKREYDHDKKEFVQKSYFVIDWDRQARKTQIIALLEKCLTQDNYMMFYGFLKGMVTSGYFFPPSGENEAVDDYRLILEKMEIDFTDDEKELYSKIGYNLSSYYRPGFRIQFRNSMTEIMKSLAAHKLLKFEFSDGKVKKVEPLKIVFYDGRWYLTALNTKAEGEGSDRIENYDISEFRNPMVDKDRFDAHDPAGIDVDTDYFGLYSEGPIKQAEIKFYGESGIKIRSTLIHSSQEANAISEEGKGTYSKITLLYAEKYAKDLIAKVLSYGSEAEVISPLELREQWLGELKAAADRYLKK